MTGDTGADRPNDLYSQYETLADAVDRLEAFRAVRPIQLDFQTYPLLSEDLDAVLGFVARTIDTDSKSELVEA